MRNVTSHEARQAPAWLIFDVGQNSMRFIYAAFSVLGIGMLIVILSTAGFSRPKAIFGAVCVIAYFGSAAARGFAFERKKRGPTYTREKDRVTNLLAIGSDFSGAVESLGARYTKVGDAAGVSLSSGTCRVIDLSGPLADVRIETKDSKISRVTVLPKQVVEFKDAVSILKEPPPPLSPSLPQTRDWMGNPLNRK